MFGETLHQYHVDETLEDIVTPNQDHPHPAKVTQTNARAWASNNKFPIKPIQTAPPERIQTSLDTGVQSTLGTQSHASIKLPTVGQSPSIKDSSPPSKTPSPTKPKQTTTPIQQAEQLDMDNIPVS